MKFVDDADQPLTLPEVHITAVDIDQSEDGKMTEIIRMPMTSYVVADDTEIAVNPLGGTNQIQLSSLYYGPGCDNPTDLSNLDTVQCDDDNDPATPDTSTNQAKRAAMLVYKDLSEINFDLEATCDGTCSSGRIFLFGWGSSLQSLCP